MSKQRAYVSPELLTQVFEDFLELLGNNGRGVSDVVRTQWRQRIAATLAVAPPAEHFQRSADGGETKLTWNEWAARSRELDRERNPQT